MANGAADPIASVRVVLAILRDCGCAFDDAWSVAYPPARSHDAMLARAALDETREAWRPAYLREPATPDELRLVALAAALDVEPADATDESAIVVG